MIELSATEKKWILLCKGHFRDQYPYMGQWTETLKPYFIEVYGWNPDEDNNYPDYLNCLFNKLLGIHLKIQDDQSGTNLQIRGIFEAAFCKDFIRDQELPIERAIAELCGLLQGNTVVTNKGEKRYNLELT
jgi:hypothetical protein